MTHADDEGRGARRPEKSSDQLLHHYTRDYYLHHLAGHQEFNAGTGDLRLFTNIFRSYSLALANSARRQGDVELPALCDIGCGRGDLAKHLLVRGGQVALVDYSEHAIDIAREFIGDQPGATFLQIDAATIGNHLPAASQDAVFMTDFTEHVSKSELRRMMPACRDILSESGSLVIHTPEKHYGSVLTQLAVQSKHINLMDIAEMQELLEEFFPNVAAFTWNGVQRFDEPGLSIELFAVASKSQPTRTLLAQSESLRFDAGESGRWSSHVLHPSLSTSPCFAVQFELEIMESIGDVAIQLLFRTDRPEDFFWTGFSTQSLVGNQPSIFLTSPTFSTAGAPQWDRVSSLEIRGRPSAGSRWNAKMRGLTLSSR
jgi:2-polyprenyl-3-methyl-5-hydroxy-6-metoxy-1,4-benzoquinol methylase